jgi:anti-repressor protein
VTAPLTHYIYQGAELRTLVEGGEILFVAADVARILGYRDAHNLTRRLDDDERGTHSVSTPSGDQDMTVITEAGLYASVLGSQVPGARDFKRWVTHEVLPAIRRTGSYSVAPAYALPQSYAEALRALAETVEAKDRAVAEAHALSPRAAAWDHMASTAGDYSVQQAAGILGRDPSITTGRQRLFQWLATAGWIFRDRSTGHWMAYASRIDSGLATHRAQHHIHPRTGEVVLDPPQVRITIKGLNALHAALGGSAPLALDHAPTALESVAQ